MEINVERYLGDLEKKIARPLTDHEHEFQEICTDLEKDFSKLVWTLPHKTWCTEAKLQKAGEIARKKGIKTFKYLVGIIKKL